MCISWTKTSNRQNQTLCFLPSCEYDDLQEGKRLRSVYPKDLSQLDALLAGKLRHFGFVP